MLLALVPLVGIIELILHVKETTVDVVPEQDWTAAHDAVAKDLKPDDLVTFAPFWTDPLGRRSFGDEIMTMKRAARSDEARFARAWEVSIRGFHDPTLEHWKKVSDQRYGGVTVTLLENPAPEKVVSDLIDFVQPDRMSVSRIEGGSESPCVFQHGATSGGSTVVPQGLLVPADKFVCQGGHVGVTVLHDLTHHPRLCINTAGGAGGVLRLKFTGVTFGESIFGHSGIQWMSERAPAHDTATITFSALDRPIATHIHRHGAGWVNFELPTPELAGKRADLVADVGGAVNRHFCFDATTRTRGTP
jgi:hypothetical protein